MKGLVLQLLLIVLQEGRPKAVFSFGLCVMGVAALGQPSCCFRNQASDRNNRWIVSESGRNFQRQEPFKKTESCFGTVEK